MLTVEDPIYGHNKLGTFTLTIEGHEIEVHYDLQAYWTMAHFEFYGPVSETGYKSHYEPYDGRFPPDWEQWITMATEFAIWLFNTDGRAYLNRENVGTQVSIFPV